MHTLTDQACHTAADWPVPAIHYNPSLSVETLQTLKDISCNSSTLLLKRSQMYSFTDWPLLLKDTAADFMLTA